MGQASESNKVNIWEGHTIKTLVAKIDLDDREKIHEAISDLYKKLGVTVAYYELSEDGTRKVDGIIYD